MSATLSRTLRRPTGVVIALVMTLSTLAGLQVATAKPAAAASWQYVPANPVAARAIKIAPYYAGRPYRWGAAGPSAFDCSGYVKYVFGRAGKVLPRTAAQQYASVYKFWRGWARPGDLVFFKDRGGHVYHVGIYAGNGYYWEAPRPGQVVKKAKIWGNWYAGRPRV